MIRIRWFSVLVMAASPLAAQTHDTSYAAMQARGKMAMGVDQNTSKHFFDDMVDGGRIELQATSDDSTAIDAIRAHLSTVASAFEMGNLAVPSFVHAGPVPGTDILPAKRAVITYTFAPLPRGGVVRITTRDSAAVRAIHQFLAYQRGAHHAGGHDMHR